MARTPAEQLEAYRKNLAEWPAERLIQEHRQAATYGLHGKYEPIEAELLRRLSAGNQQAEKVQISETRCPCGCGQRIEEEHPLKTYRDHIARIGADYGAKQSGEQRETRIQGEEHPIDTLLRQQADTIADREFAALDRHAQHCNTTAMLGCALCVRWADASVTRMQAQRSAGRIEAGSER